MPNTIKSLRASILLGFAAIFSFSSCQYDNLEPNRVYQRDQKVTIEATYEQPEMETKTVRDDNAKIYWTPGDAISLFFGSGTDGGSKFLAQNTAVSLKTTFSGYISAVTGGSDIDDDDTFFWGLYPYDATASCDGSSVTMKIPALQPGMEGTFAPGMAPSLGRSQKLVLSFRNIWSGFGFTVSEPGFQSITFRGNAGEQIAGKARIGIDENNLPKVLEILEGVQSVTLTAPGGGFVPGQYYYMQFFPCTFESGFSVELVSPTKKGTYNYTKSMEYPRSTWKRAANVDTRVEDWINIDPADGYDWDVIPTDLVTVNNPTKGGLEDVLLEWGDYESITSLKVTGTMNDVDFLVIYRDMPNLRYLDISGIDNTTLPKQAFYKSTNVTHVILPEALTEIGDYMFSESKIVAIKMKGSVRRIGDYAFNKCGISAIEIPPSVEYIGSSAFSSTDLAIIYIPASVETIGQDAFNGCDSLLNVSFENDSNLKSIGYRAFSHCAALVSIEIPASVETIGQLAFESCESLTNVSFETGSHLRAIEGGEAGEFGKGVFYYCTSLMSIEIPASVESIGKTAFKECRSLTFVTFEKNSHLKSIEGGGYGNVTTHYEYGAFHDCVSLVSIEIPASVEIIGQAAFKNCISLTSVTFEEGSHLKTIDGGGYGKSEYCYLFGAFCGCKSLISVKIPASVEAIGQAAFQGCTSLTSVTFEEGSQLTTIDGGYHFNANPKRYYYWGAFSDCSALSSIEIPASVITIGKAAFKNCNSLTSVSFESGSHLKTIDGGDRGSGAFAGTPIVSIVIPASVESIGTDAFAGCDLKSVIFESGSQIKTLNTGFGSCKSLTKVTFKENSQLTTLSSAFSNCSNLKTFDASGCASLTRIYDEVFKDLDKLRLFYCGAATPPTIGSKTFYGIDPYAVLKVPDGSVDAYKAISNWNSHFSQISGFNE